MSPRNLPPIGAKVLIHGRDSARAQTLSEEIKRAGGGEPAFYQADLSSLAGVRQLADAVLADHSGSMSSSAMPGSDRRMAGPDGRPARTGMNCGSR